MLVYLQMIETIEDKVKFEQIYTTYRGLMYYIATRFLSSEQDAEDAVHQAFVSIISNLNKISQVESPETRAYIVIIVERKALDIIRTNKMYTDELTEEQQGVAIPLPGDSKLANALSQLPAHYRELLLLKYDHGYTTKEVAKILDMSHAGAEKMLWRAKKALAEALESEAN